MPNAENVTAPINIHGIGRSGTTLLQNILGKSGFIQVCNETAAFVFCCYRGGESLNPSFDKQAIGRGGDPTMAARGLHAALCATMPSPKPVWCQKLGGIPNGVVWETIIDEGDRRYAPDCYPFPYAWFWRTLAHAFPYGYDVLILRDYRDVIVSRTRFSGYDAVDVAADVAVYFNLMAHPASRIGHVMRYEALAVSPEAVVSTLFAALGLTFEPAVMAALAWHAAPSPDRSLETARAAGFTWRSERDAVLADLDHSAIGNAVARLNSRFGVDLEIG